MQGVHIASGSAHKAMPAPVRILIPVYLVTFSGNGWTGRIQSQPRCTALLQSVVAASLTDCPPRSFNGENDGICFRKD